MNYTNPWSGKPVDKISDLLPSPNGGTCDECGSPCINNCIMCGAPQCCPACCYEDTPSARITGDKDRETPVEGAPYGEGLIGRINQLEYALALTRRGWAFAQDQQLRLMTERQMLVESHDELLAAAEKALNYIANTEGELGITLSSGDALRAAIAKARGQ